MAHTFSIGQSLWKRTTRALTRLGSPAAEVSSTHPLLPTVGQGSAHVERRLGNQDAQVGRRRSDAVTPDSDTPRLLLVEPDQVTRVLYASMFEDAGFLLTAGAGAAQCS